MSKLMEIMHRPRGRTAGEVLMHPRATAAELYRELIDAIAEKQREIAGAHAELVELVQAAGVQGLTAAHLLVRHDSSLAEADETRLAKLAFTAEVAAAMRIASINAQKLIATADTLTRDLPGTMQALRSGDISFRHAEAMVDEVWGLGGDAEPDQREAAIAAFEDAALPYAQELTPGRFRSKARQLRERTHPETIEARRVKAAGDRRFTFESSQDGMAWVSLFCEAPLALAIHDRVTQVAARVKEQPGEQRGLAQLRADVATELLLRGGVPGQSGDPGGHDGQQCNPYAGIRPTVFVTVPVLTLLGLSEEPATLEGHGPIDADTARQLTAQAPSLYRILTHPETGTVLSLGRTRYAIPPDLRRWLQLRDGTCRFVCCGRPAQESDIDHTREWSEGGESDDDNLACVCPLHNRILKVLTGWHAKQLPDHDIVWTSPAGREYVTRPEIRLDPHPDLSVVAPVDDPWSTAPPSPAELDSSAGVARPAELDPSAEVTNPANSDPPPF